MHYIKKDSHDHSHHYTSEKNISIAFFLNLGFTIVEIIGGILTNSVAILADAVHDLGDSVSLGLAWYFQKISRRGSNQRFSYGYKRFSLLGAMINVVILTVGSVLILIETVPRLFNPSQPHVEGMLILAILGMIVNGAAVWRLKKGNSINEKVVSLHLWEDVLGWAAVFVGSIVMYFTDLPVIDPILSMLISIYILYHAVRNVGATFRIILQGTPDEIDPASIRSRIVSLQDVADIHDLHSWSIDGTYHIATLHVVLKSAVSPETANNLKNDIRIQLRELNIQHVTIEFEIEGDNCSMEHCS